MSPSESFRVLVVCVGNVCRSPIMERFLRQRLPWALVESAGVSAVVGSDMHPRSRASLAELEADLDDFEARQLTRPLVDSAQLILTADRFVRGRLLEEHPKVLGRTFTLRELAVVAAAAPNEVSSPPELVRWAGRHRSVAAGHSLDIADPIGRSDHIHSQAAQLVAEHTRLVADALNAVRDREHRSHRAEGRSLD